MAKSKKTAYETTIGTPRARGSHASLLAEAHYSLGTIELCDLVENDRLVKDLAGALAVLGARVSKERLYDKVVGVCAPIILDPDKRVNGSDRSVAMAGSGSPDCLRTMAGSAEPYAATSIDLALHRPDFAGATALLDIPEVNSRADAAKAGLKVMRLGDAMLYIAQRQIQYALTDEPIIDRLLDRTIYFPNDPSILDYPVDGVSSERIPIMSPGDNGVPEIHLVDSRPDDATVVPALKVRVSTKELRLAS